jgi:hypothetical protein
MGTDIIRYDMRMRLPSLDQIADGTRAALVRFPGPLLAALLATISAFVWIGDRVAGDEPAMRLLASAILAMPLGVAGTVGLERRFGDSTLARVGGLLVAALVIPLYWLGFPRWTEDIQASRFLHLAILFHLLVAFVPFIGHHEPNAFWQFNRRLFERWLLGVVYAAALFVGLSLALLALDKLFGAGVPDRTYARLWATMAFLFHPLFFLAGAPRDLAALEPDRSWPGGLRAFARFVLVPLTTIYLLILTAYFVKVVATGAWPSGWIGWLVSGAASVGILTLLLSGPPATRHEAPWASLFERWFWPAVLPAAIMLLLAIWKRVDQYGITERRYFLAVLALWLLGIAMAFTIRRRLDLIVIPVSLAVVAAAIFAGPWGAYQSARRSQYARLEAALQSTGALSAGRLTNVAESADREAAGEAANIVRYLVRTHGSQRMVKWLGDRGFIGSDLPADTSRYSRAYAEPFVTALGLAGYDASGERRYLWVNREAVTAVEVTGFDLLVPIRHRSPGDTLWPSGDTLSAGLGFDRRSVEVRRGNLLLSTIGLNEAIDSLAAWRLRTPSGSPPPDSLLSVRAPDGSARLYIRQIGVRDSAGTWRAEQLDGEVLLRLSPDASR